jgi:hypothetical protein
MAGRKVASPGKEKKIKRLMSSATRKGEEPTIRSLISTSFSGHTENRKEIDAEGRSDESDLDRQNDDHGVPDGIHSGLLHNRVEEADGHAEHGDAIEKTP